MIENWNRIRQRRQQHADSAMRDLAKKIAQRDTIMEGVEKLQLTRNALLLQRRQEVADFESSMTSAPYQNCLSVSFNQYLRRLRTTDRHVHFQIFELKLALNAACNEVALAQQNFRNMTNKCEKIDEIIRAEKKIDRLRQEALEEDEIEERSMQRRDE